MRVFLSFVMILFVVGPSFSMGLDFSLKDLSGKMVSLSDLLESGPVVLDFWATWCGPCVKELPHIQSLHEEFSHKGITIVGISEDGTKTVSKVKPFVKTRRYTFPVLLDTNQKVMRMFKISSIPYVCIIDTTGELYYSHLGYKPGDEKELRNKILELLGEDHQEHEE